MATKNVFTAAQIARALGQKRQAVQRALASIVPSDQVRVNGIVANAWQVCALPADLQGRLDAVAQAHSRRNAEYLLRDPAPIAQPPRRVRKLVIPLSVQDEFRELLDVIAVFKNPGAPTIDEKSYLWLRALELYEEKINAGAAEKKTRTRLVKFLARNAVFLSENLTAMRVAFRRKYSRWIQSDRTATALQDGRKEHSGFTRAPDLPEADRMLLTAASAKLGGGIEQAWEMCHRNLSQAIREYYPNTQRCPTLIRETIRYDVPLAKIGLKGPRAMRTAGAYVNRDPNGIAAGDWDQSDDMTMVNVWWDDAPDSPEGFWFGQGQLLVWVDERSWFGYSWDLISDPYYDAFSIRNSWNLKAKTWGLPRKGLSLERGIWQTSRIIVGERVKRDSAVGIAESASTIQRLDLRFHNATHARVKIIERIYGLLQDYFQAAPGYVGRNPITDRYERVQEQIRLVKSGKAHPSEFFLHKSQWAAILDKVLLTFNDHQMHGKYHEGRSPKQTYQDEFSVKLVHVPEELAHAFADECFVRPVTQNGVTIPLGKRKFTYKGARLGHLRGQHVKIWFSPSEPAIARCTDLQGRNSFIVEREARPYNHDSPDGILEKALEQNARQDRYMKELHRSLKPYYNSQFFNNLFRPVILDREAVELSKERSSQIADIKSRRSVEEKQQTKARKAAHRLNIQLTPTAARRPDTGPALERLNELLNEQEST